MLEEKPEYKKRKKYTKRRQQVIRQLFFLVVSDVSLSSVFSFTASLFACTPFSTDVFAASAFLPV